MDEITKYRITGAVIWLALLIIFVPSWYSHPVDYQQQHAWETPVEVLSDEALPEPKGPVSESSDLVEDEKAETAQKAETKDERTIQTKQTDTVEQQQTLSQPQVGSPSIEIPKREELGSQADVSSEPTVKPESSVKPESTETSEPPHQVEREAVPEERSPAWLIRVASYSSIKSANQTLGLLELRYQVTIGDFSSGNRKIYSVRVGPYYSFEEAQKVKQALDTELNTNSVIVQIR